MSSVIKEKYLIIPSLIRLGYDLHLERLRKGLSIFDAAKQINIPYQTIDSIERGKFPFNINIYQTLFELYNYKIYIAPGDEYDC